MASESSSAVLELNDADYNEDTEPPSITEDANDVPLIMEHGYDIAVKVDSPLKQLSTLETFVTYRVRCVCARWATPPHVRRRYNHFKVLHKRLSAAHPLIAAPPLPPLHSAMQQLDRYSPSFVAIRTLALNAFLERIAKHPIFTHSEDLRLFVTTPDEDIERVMKVEGGGLQLWGLGSALGAERPGNGPRVKDPEFKSAAEYLSSLQHKLATLCSLTTKLHQGSAALGTEFMSMKRACDAWFSQAGGRGAGAVGAGAGAAAGAGARRPAGGSLRARATLPLLAAYAAAHRDKVKHRDALHATYVSGNNATGEVHNRLEQASEALRSELSDWIPKTRSEIKSLLLEMADHQVAIHSQTLKGWEHALKLSTEADISEVFKTVSKNAVQNLSPSKFNTTPTETEKDFDDFVSNSSEDDVSKSKASEENYEVVDTISKNSDADSKNGEINSKNSDVRKDIDEVLKHESLESEPRSGEVQVNLSEQLRLKSDNAVNSDPLRDFSEIDLSS